MKLYRKVVPKIAKDIIRSLLANHAVEIEEGHRDEAELDIAAVVVEYLNAIDQIKTEASDTLQRHNLSYENLPRIKRSLAEQHKIVLGEGALEFVINKIIEGLFNSKHIIEVFGEDNEMRKMIHDSIGKYVGVDEELDREVRGRIKNLREGTAEWEVEYNRLIEQMRVHKDKVSV
jgi:uncharacterized protein